MKRRANVYYSDLFGRSAAYEDAEVLLSARSRPKSRTGHEDHLIVHQDTSVQARIFGEGDARSWQGSGKLEAVTHDNSEKIKYKDGMKPQELQQAHLRASIQSEEFYKVATNIKDWEVIELHLPTLITFRRHMAAESEGAAAPPPSPRVASKACAADQSTGTSVHSRAALQRIFEKYGGDHAQSRKLTAVLESAAPHALPRERPSPNPKRAWARFQLEASGAREGPGLGPEVLNRLTSEVPGSTLTPYGVGVLESEADDRGMVRVRFPWGRAELRAKDATGERRALLRRSLEALSSLLVVLIKALGQAPGTRKALEAAVACLTCNGRTSPFLEELLDLALLLSAVVRTRAELLRLDGVSTHPQLQAELLAADALRIHLGLLEPPCAWRLVRPGAKVIDPLTEEELLASLPASSRPHARLAARDREITSVKVTAGPVLRGPPRTTVVRSTSLRSPSPVISHTVTNTSSTPLSQTFRTSGAAGGDTIAMAPFVTSVPRFYSGDFPLPPSPLSFFGPRRANKSPLLIATGATSVATSHNASVADTPDACATPLAQEMQEVLEEHAEEQESGSSSEAEASPANPMSQSPCSSQGAESSPRVRISRMSGVRQRADAGRARAPSPEKAPPRAESPVVRVTRSERSATKSRKVVWR
eukprot:s1840_g6.t1